MKVCQKWANLNSEEALLFDIQDHFINVVHFVHFRASTVISILLGIVGVLGNGVVIYVAATGQNTGPLRLVLSRIISKLFFCFTAFSLLEIL